MTKSTILKTGVFICNFLRWTTIILLLTFSGLFVHYQINPSGYKNVYVNTHANANIIFFHSSAKTINSITKNLEISEDTKVFPVNQLTKNSLYFNYIKLILTALLGLLCIIEFQKVIESVKEIKTFQKRNITSFRKIGKYLILTSIILSYSSFSFKTGSIAHNFDFSFNLIFLAIIAYIMAEVFKEGNSLSEENELTV